MSACPFGGFADVTIVTFVFLGRRADLITAQGGAQTVPTNTGSIRRRADELNMHLYSDRTCDVSWGEYLVLGLGV